MTYAISREEQTDAYGVPKLKGMTPRAAGMTPRTTSRRRKQAKPKKPTVREATHLREQLTFSKGVIARLEDELAKIQHVLTTMNELTPGKKATPVSMNPVRQMKAIHKKLERLDKLLVEKTAMQAELRRLGVELQRRDNTLAVLKDRFEEQADLAEEAMMAAARAKRTATVERERTKEYQDETR